MADFGLSDYGFLAPRAIDLLDQIRADYEAETGLTIDWAPDAFLGVITAIVADRAGDLSEMLQALADSRDPDSATGHQLDTIAAIVGVTRLPAAYSAVDLTLYGDPGTFIPQGSEVEHPNGTLWRTAEDVTIGGGGTATVEARPLETGAITAPASSTWEITTPVDGWESVETFSDATPGRDRESDSELRLRRRQSLQIAGSASVEAIRAHILNVEGIQAAVVVDNDRKTTEIVAGLTLPASSFAVVVYPPALTGAQERALAEEIYGRAPIGIESIGNEEIVIAGEDGFDKTVRFSYAEEIPVDVDVTYTGDVGLEAEIVAEVEAYFSGLGVGEPARILAILGRLSAVPGVESATVLFDASSADIIPEITQIAVAGAIAVTRT